MTIGISTAKSRKSTSWTYREVDWEVFVERCVTPRRTPESVAEYRAMTREQQGAVKDVGGFVGASLMGNVRKNRNVQTKTMFTFDLDTIDISAEALADMIDVGLSGVIYSTHKHTAENPRLRIVIPFNTPLAQTEMYEPAMRMLAKQLGILKYCDATTFDLCRLFYWPSVSRDGEFFSRRLDGAAADPLKLCLTEYTDWRDVAEWPRVPGETEPQRVAAMTGRGTDAQDPLTKTGVVGAFCRAHFPIGEAAVELLDEYRPGQGKRLTFAAGTTVNGVIIYDDRWVYSHHCTDPAQGRLLNIFDLVRIHKYGHLDEGTRAQSDETMPSMSAMLEFAAKDEATCVQLDTERQESCKTDFADLIGGDGINESNGSNEVNRTKETDNSWVAGIPDRHPKTGKIESNVLNIKYIMFNDPLLKNLIRYNQFADKIEITRKTPWGTEGVWSDRDDSALRNYLEERFQITGRDKVYDVIAELCVKNAYHPVKDYFDNLKWDGTPRLERLFVDYLGAEDNELNRFITALMFTAAVARIYEPGTKFDYCCVLYGPEGIGKSTVLSTMGGEWFTDSANPADPKTFIESIQGKLLVEWGEMRSLEYAEDAGVKSVLSRQIDRARKAYGRRVEESPRQCVIFGTTNDDTFLRGENGTRRFLVLPVTGENVTKDFTLLHTERDQLWAEAIEFYRRTKAEADRRGVALPLFLPKKLDDEAKARTKQYNFDEAWKDVQEDNLRAFLDFKLPADWESRGIAPRRAHYLDPDMEHSNCLREKFCIKEFLEEYIGMKKNDKYFVKVARLVGKLMKNIEGWEGPKLERVTGYGVQKVYTRIAEYKTRN